jgi:hypothetical protein
MAVSIAQLVVPADAYSTPQAAIIDWPRRKVYLWRQSAPPGTIRSYDATLATQSPITSALLDQWIYTADVDPVSGAVIAQTDADINNGAPIIKYDATTFAALGTYGGSGIFPSYPGSVRIGGLVCVECNGVGYALHKEGEFSGAVAVIRTDTMAAAGFYSSVVSGALNNAAIMCRGISGPGGGSAFLTWDGSSNGQTATIPLYTVAIAPGAETYDPASWPTPNAFISSATVGTIAAADIDPAWTTLAATSIGVDATDGNVLLDVTGTGGGNARYVAKVNAATAAVLWAVPMASASALPGYNVTRSRTMFLPSGALDTIRTDTGELTTTALTGLSGLGSVMSDDVSGPPPSPAGW